MLYKILQVSTDRATGHTYVLVHFWRDKADQILGKEPDRVNDFLMQLRPTGVRIVTNRDGWYKRLNDGVFVNPETLDPDEPQPEWERETIDRDLPTEIKANIEAYWERAESGGFPANHTNRAIQRDNSDPHDVLARADVVALRGEKVERS